jgi:hypothetical protein
MENYNYIGERVTSGGFGFLNMNRNYDEIGLDPATDFKDNGNHTNAAGAEKVTAWFGKWLKEHYELPDRRGDAAYTSWQQAYERWKAEQAEDLQTIKQHVADGSFAEITEEK